MIEKYGDNEKEEEMGGEVEGWNTISEAGLPTFNSATITDH